MGVAEGGGAGAAGVGAVLVARDECFPIAVVTVRVARPTSRTWLGPSVRTRLSLQSQVSRSSVALEQPDVRGFAAQCGEKVVGDAGERADVGDTLTWVRPRRAGAVGRQAG